MGRARWLRLAARWAALTATASVALVGTASSAPPFKEEFHDEFSEVIEDYCGVEGLTVQRDVVADGRVMGVAHGPDGFVYFLEHAEFTVVDTNLVNGETATGVISAVTKDLKVTDNGDGTLTILVLATGNAVLYGSDGEVIARDPGQVRFEILVDHAGTPSDPSDDEFLAFLGVVKESTGRSDDFCAAAAAEIS